MKQLLWMLIMGLLLSACKKEQPQLRSLEEDCGCAKEVSADFVMEEMTTGNINFARYTNTDSIFGDKNVRFTALEENADYTWYIGSEVIKTKEVTRFFPNSMVGQTIPVTLVTKKKANIICLPNDDGYDSIVKYLTIAETYDYDGPFVDSTFIEGTYRLKSPLLQDSIDMIIDYRYQGVGFFGVRLNIYNYDGSGNNCIDIMQRREYNYRQFWTFDQTAINAGDYLQGDFKINLNGLVEANFTTGGYVDGVYNQKLYDWKYRGRKL